MSKPEIQKTTDYSIFKLVLGNRKIHKPFIRRLKESIEKENLLHLHPIILNSEMGIIDGQHRLEVAKQLNLPVYYIKSDTVTDEHVVTGNSNQQTFKTGDFLDFFAMRDKNEHYIRLISLMKSTKLGLRAILALILGTNSGPMMEMVRTGIFKFPDNVDFQEFIDTYLDLLAFSDERKIKPRSMFSNFQFCKAFRWLLQTSKFNKQYFFNRLSERWYELRPQGTTEDWYKSLLEVYNYKNRNPIEDQFTE